MINQAELKKTLRYNRNTGLFTRLIANNGNVRVGEIAGNFHKSGYIRISINKKLYLAHRLACLYMTGSFPKKEIDHINSIKNDNRWINLREATRSQNSINTGAYITNKLGIKGVHFYKGKFRASLKLNGKQKHLGCFLTIKEASQAYQDFCRKHHGEFFYQEESCRPAKT